MSRRFELRTFIVFLIRDRHKLGTEIDWVRKLGLSRGSVLWEFILVQVVTTGPRA